MDLDREPQKIAQAAGEEVRALNHATIGSGRLGWEFPSDAYSVIGGLDQLATGLPQAIDQIRAHLSRLATDGHVRSDRGDTDKDLAAAHSALTDARAAALVLAEALGRAHSATSPLSYQD